MNSSVLSFFKSIYASPVASCASYPEEEVDMDDPAFGKIDPNQNFDDIEREAVMRMGKSPRKPPSFDGFIGSIKSLTKKFDHIKGFKFEVGAAPSQQFHMIHAWNILPPAKAGARMGPGGDPMMGGAAGQGQYTLMAQYIGLPDNLSPMMMPQPSFILTGRMDTNGRLEAVFIKQLAERASLRVNFGFPTEDLNMAQMHCDLDYEGDDYTHTFKVGTGMWGFNYMQTIGRNLVLGFDLMNLTERKATMMSYAARYIYQKHTFFAQWQAMQKQCTIAYLQKINRNAQLVSEFNYTPAEQETTSAVFGFRQRFTNTEVVATVNSKGKISSLINIMGGIYTLKLCATANYKKDSYKFGYGISFGQTS